MWLIHFIYDVTSDQNYYKYGFGFSVEMGQSYVTTVSDVPYHVLVVYGDLFCSGTLVRSKIVLTTAGCMTAASRQRTFVKVGGNSITGLGQVIPVVNIKIHEYFRYYSRMDNDIAMLVLKYTVRLSIVGERNNNTTVVRISESYKYVAEYIPDVENVQFSNKVKKVILVDAENVVEPGITIEVSGWASQGLLHRHANLLLKTNMVIVDREECKQKFQNLITPSHFCARFHHERRVNDIGGPATHKQQLVGILSFAGTNKHKTDDVVVFTNISYFHRWILLNTKRFLEKYCVVPKDTFYSNLSSTEVQISRDLYKLV